LIVGCPETGGQALSGRVMMVYLNKEMDDAAGYTVIPDEEKDQILGLRIPSFASFGQSLTMYMDLDKNGLHEIIVGAPSENSTLGSSNGALYMLFTRRKRYHPPPFDFVRFYLLVAFLPGTCSCIIFWSIAAFCFIFRRIPDEVEIIVKKSGYEINPNRARPKYKKRTDQVHVEEYTL
jgi:hypothetical protein